MSSRPNRKCKATNPPLSTVCKSSKAMDLVSNDHLSAFMEEDQSMSPQPLIIDESQAEVVMENDCGEPCRGELYPKEQGLAAGRSLSGA
ncbi:Uncharacterized protein APZ42_008327 [Daphnia magna]|uniref:Uncharacterized protein n=1 Tax=Daphnia magna TaxID=35525 RepID=A0A164EQ94_9CRUS|nr:Uncharacterized protein APZ42_008327 [Daphnia magna]